MVVVLAVLAMLPAACNGVRSHGSSPTLTVTCIREPEQLQTEQAIADGFTEQTGIRVRIVPTLESATDRLHQYLALLENRSATPDVYHLDVVWPGMLVEHLIDLAPYLGAESSKHFPQLQENATVGGRLVAMPVAVDSGLLHYRSDLLREYGFSAPPQSWPELERMARRIQAGERKKGNPDFWGYVWQGAPYEGLTCNGLEWQVAEGGGHIVETDGTVSINNPKAVMALERAAGWVNSISPPGVVAYKEQDANNVWQAGNAAFMRNWFYAYEFAEKEAPHLRGRIGVARLPGGGTLGGGAIAVSRYSPHVREAIDFIRYITSERRQRSEWLKRVSMPTIPALYRETPTQSLVEPLAGIQRSHLAGLILRPSTTTAARYDQVSRAYFLAVHSVLTRRQTAARALASLEQELRGMLGPS
jgi:trehalose/maltose transport system substrate-binding protein